MHDIGDTLGPANHADIAAVLLQPYVSEANHWMVKHHAIFHSYYFFEYLGLDKNMRETYKDHPMYEQTLEFIEKYDAPAFDPEAETPTVVLRAYDSARVRKAQAVSLQV